MKLLYEVKQRLTRSAFLTRWLFGVHAPALADGNRYFDLTTLALQREARRRIARGARVLDMGTGTTAVLGIWIERELGCEVLGTDVDPKVVADARENVRRNGAVFAVEQASLFDGVAGEFDWVLFNPPYLRTAFGRERDQPQELRTMWDGGADGTETVAAFLDAYAARETNATALLGVNRMHVPRERLRALIAARAALEASELAAHPWLPVDVHVLIRSKSRSASVSTPLA